jgi:hypothetical protein
VIWANEVLTLLYDIFVQALSLHLLLYFHEQVLEVGRAIFELLLSFDELLHLRRQICIHELYLVVQALQGLVLAWVFIEGAIRVRVKGFVLLFLRCFVGVGGRLVHAEDLAKQEDVFLVLVQSFILDFRFWIFVVEFDVDSRGELRLREIELVAI